MKLNTVLLAALFSIGSVYAAGERQNCIAIEKIKQATPKMELTSVIIPEKLYSYRSEFTDGSNQQWALFIGPISVNEPDAAMSQAKLIINKLNGKSSTGFDKKGRLMCMFSAADKAQVVVIKVTNKKS